MSATGGAARRAADRVGATVTELIGNAAGTAVDPATGLKKLVKAAGPTTLVFGAGVAVAALVMRQRRSPAPRLRGVLGG